MRPTKPILLLCMALASGSAFADSCLTRQEKDAIENSCREKATGFLGHVNYYAQKECEDERTPKAEAEACARQKAEADKRIDINIQELLAGRGSCFHRGVSLVEYKTCMDQRKWADLDKDLSLFQSLCSGFRSGTGCQYDVWDLARNKQRDEEQRQEAEQQAALRKKCGADYHKIRIGMSIERLKQCSGSYGRKVGEMYRKDGVLVSTYNFGGGAVYVINGRISGWQAPY